jgi:AraC-like DNA-binding protein
MPAIQSGVSLLRISTRTRQESERIPFWCEFFGKHIIRTRIELAPGTGFDAKGTLLSVPGLRVHWSSYSAAARILRPRELISSDDDNIALLIDRIGTVAFSQGGRDVSLEKGGSVAVLHSETATMAFSNARYMAVMAPLKALNSLTHSVEDRAGYKIPPNNDALHLLARYVDLLRREPLLSDGSVIADVVTHVHDLMALVLGATRDGGMLANGRGVRAARFKEIHGHISANIATHELSVQTVAAHYGLTPRYIQMLFEREGMTFSTFLRDQRLVRAHTALRSLRRGGESISSIAFAVGFADLSYFNRSFRKKFGVTPTEVRIGR